MNFALPKQSQRSRSVLQDGSLIFGIVLEGEKLCLISGEIRYLHCSNMPANTVNEDNYYCILLFWLLNIRPMETFAKFKCCV